MMPADLDPLCHGADVIGVVDHPMRQPEITLLDGLEMGLICALHGILWRFRGLWL